MQLSSVVLPAPFGPMTDTISPLATSKPTPLTACTPPNDFETSRSSTWVLTGWFICLGSPLAHVAMPRSPPSNGATTPGAGARACRPPRPQPPPRGRSVGDCSPFPRSRQPSLAAPVVLHVPVALAPPDPGEPEIELL